MTEKLRPTAVNRLDVRIKTAVAIGFFAFTLQGCADMSPSAPPVTLPTDTPAPTVDISPIPTEKPHPVGFVNEANGQIGWWNEKGEHLTVPNLPYLEAKIQDGSVIYVAQTGNEYGLKVDGKTEVARFKTDVMESGARVGGLIVDGNIAVKLMKSSTYTIPIPVAPDGQLDIDYYTQTSPTQAYRAISIKYQGETLLRNPIPNNKGIYCSVQFPWDGRTWSIFDKAGFSDSQTLSVPPINSIYLFGAGKPDISIDTLTKSNYQVDAPLMSVTDEIDIIAGTTQSAYDLGPSNILRANHSPILLGYSTK